MALFGLTIFVGAFLLFQVQPLIGKYILPWFGGGPGVWTTCLLFFQVLLLGGYAYAHGATRRLQARSQLIVHLGLAAAALALLPIIPGSSWKPRGGGDPTLQILLLLTVNLGLPYFVLSATGPLLQVWFSRVHPGRSPYRLYALSNAGSLLALVSYPFYFESHFTRQAQARLWSGGLVCFAAGLAACAYKLWKAQVLGAQSAARSAEPGIPAPVSGSQPAPETGNPKSQIPDFKLGIRNSISGIGEPGPEPAGPRFGNGSGQPAAGGPVSLEFRRSALDRLLWVLLPACASVLLLATTNKLCQDVAVFPFLWVLPLGLYLLSFIICFEGPRWYPRFPFTLALLLALGGLVWALESGNSATLEVQVEVYSGALFICCMVCHGELYRLRPGPERLTAFYLSIAAGGALGGFFVAVVAPRLFTAFYELHWGALACGLLFLVACLTERWAVSEPRGPRSGVWWGRIVSFLGSPFRRGDDWYLMACVLPVLPLAVQRRALLAKLSSHVALLALVAAVLYQCWKCRRLRFWRPLACAWLAVYWCALAVALWTHCRRSDFEVVHTSRSFYGMLTVFEHRKDQPEGHHFLLMNGRITHGLQFVDRERAMWPTTYYGPQSGVGLAARALPAGPRRLGLVGLGTGTLAAYGRAGDSVRIYEINPQVRQLANSWFTYLARCPAKVEVVLGDARLSLEREPPQRFDLLALDAFSSDAIPVHLLTREAVELYQRHLKPNGVLAIHISNHYLDLEPVVANLARHFGYQAALVDNGRADQEWWIYSSTWMLLTRDEGILKAPGLAEARYSLEGRKAKLPLWTDDYASLLPILK